MIAVAALLAAVAVSPVRAEPAEAPSSSSASEKGSPSLSSGRTEVAEAVDAVARRYHLAGELLVAKGDRVLLDRGYGTISPTGGEPHKAGERWRLASITKQVTAALIVRSLVRPDGFAGALDVPIAPALDMPNLGQVTLRQLLTHHTGLANPDTSPAGPDGVPGFYKAAAPDLAYCRSRPPTAGAPFLYNNCDYLVAGLALIGDRDDVAVLWPTGMTMARKDERGLPGFVGGKPEPDLQLSSFFTAGGLLGTARAVFDFDRSLMTGKLLSPAALAELWKPEGNGSYQALGQWVFPGQLKGCAAPKRIVQRDGEIGGVQARNFILPDDGIAVVVFTNRSSDDFPIGGVWEGKGFAYDLLSAAVCS